MFFTLLYYWRLINTKPLQILIDIEIIEQCRKGDLHDFKKLVERSSPFAFSVAFRMVGDEERAKDITQETMITVWKSIKNIKSAESYKTWLYRIVLNKCYDMLRKRKREPEFRTDEKGWEILSNRIFENPSAELENREMALIISNLTENLSPRQKAVFILADIEDLSNDEVGQITGMSSFNVKANLHYARKKIGELIQKHL
jgi:RNA polymerase sigma-70 factor (ECF subfamily)